MTAANTATIKLCSSCRHELPLDQFRRRYADRDDIRHSECTSCYSAYNRRWRAKRKAKAVHDFARCAAKADKFAQVDGLVTAMVRRLGGLEAFTRLWFESIQAARPGSRVALLSFLAISNMMRQADAERPQPKAPEDMTIEEIDAEMAAILREAQDKLDAKAAMISWHNYPGSLPTSATDES